jgi:acetyltransferase-like isoleucine patch superfamily enzyme
MGLASNTVGVGVKERDTIARVARSHGSGAFSEADLARCGKGVIFEPGVLVFHPENIEIADDVYVGHYAILKGYFKNRMVIGARSWIGQQCFLHAAGGITIGARVGIGPGARLLTSTHELPADRAAPIMDGALRFAPIVLEDGCDIGVGATILPGVTVGRGAQVGAGAVVAEDVPAGAIAAGVPARVLRHR